MSPTHYEFRGDPEPLPPPDSHADSPKNPDPYIASEELVQAVNLAIHLNRPLLLEGEAGCGKTRLSGAVAYELGLPLYIWNVKSTSKASNGFYEYDAILRLHDVHVSSHGQQVAGEALDGSGPRDPSNAKHYRRLGPLGRAFIQDRRAVVLIDEIDKADVDFPNDLLTAIDDRWSFEIPETGELIKATHKPIVLITSNKEKGNLPAPFLRRCVYTYLQFPERDQLKRIVDAHYTHSDTSSESPQQSLKEEAILRFYKLRGEEVGLYKKPGTSEFLDWLEALHSFQGGKNPKELLSPQQQLPFPGLLLKLRGDWLRDV